MALSSKDRKTRQANKAAYAPKPKPVPVRPVPKPAETHAVGDHVLRKIIQRVLAELKLPGKIPSEVLFTALAEVRDLVEQSKKPR